MKKEAIYQVAVVGAGASGLAAAVRCAQVQRETGQKVSVLVLEGSAKPGRKLLATGNGKCNLTNLSAVQAGYHGDVHPAAAVLQACPPARVRAWFRTLGLLTKADEAGRVYPCNEQASAVLDCLCAALEDLGGTLCCGAAVTRICRENDSFALFCGEEQVFHAGRVILAGGGLASPKLGCGSDAAKLAVSLGHTVTPRFPALVRLISPEIPAALKGVRVKTEVSLLDSGKPLAQAAGEAIFGAGSLSGICVMQVSRLAAQRGKSGGKLTLSMDLLPDLQEKALADWMHTLAGAHPAWPAARLLAGVLPTKLGPEVLRRCRVTRTCGELNRRDLAALAHAVKHFTLKIEGTGNWDDAQVTAGGVPFGELNVPAMASRRCPGLFITGELVNLDGDCGGFNLQWAWATGLSAGEAAARVFKKGKGKR